MTTNHTAARSRRSDRQSRGHLCQLKKTPCLFIEIARYHLPVAQQLCQRSLRSVTHKVAAHRNDRNDRTDQLSDRETIVCAAMRPSAINQQRSNMRRVFDDFKSIYVWPANVAHAVKIIARSFAARNLRWITLRQSARGKDEMYFCSKWQRDRL